MFKSAVLDTDADQAAEAEVQRLQKQLRKLDKDRRTFIDDRSRRHAKRQQIIAALRTERAALRERVVDHQHGPHARRTADLEQQMLAHQADEAATAAEFEEKKLALWQLDGNIRKMEREIRQLRESECTDRQYRTELERTGAAVAKLENQLDVVNKRWGATMAENTQLRAAIDHQLLERQHFNALWLRAAARLDQGKRYIGELIDQSTAAYEQREELCTKIQTLRERGLTDGSQHLQEMRELQRRLDYDARLQQFFTCKGQRRHNAELEQRAAAKRDQAQLAVQQEIDGYERLLGQMREIGGEVQDDRLPECFRKREEENFALFSYVNELNAEVEQLQSAVLVVERAIEQQRGENERKQLAQLESLEMLQRRLEEKRAETAERERIQRNIEQKLADLLAGVARIYELLRCDGAPVLELLGSDGGGSSVVAGATATASGGAGPAIDIHNVQLFLGVVRRRAQLIINTVNMALLPCGLKAVLARKDRVPKFNVKESAKAPPR